VPDGYHGSARTLRSLAAAQIGELEALADLVVVDAPSLAAGDYGWWHAVDAERDAADDPGVGGAHRHYKGWARTRAAIVDVFSTRGPFDGVFGFSPGRRARRAARGAARTGRAAHGRATATLRLRDPGQRVSGQGPELAQLYARFDSYAAPSPPVFGRADGIVPIEDLRALAARFANPIVIEHAGGHVIPSEPTVRERVRTFLTERARERDAASDADRPPIDVPLWGAGRPSPSMHVVFPSHRRSAPALVVFRGGGYATNAGSGAGAAEWAADNGMVGIEVPYRTQAEGSAFPDNYADAARAVRLVRAHAPEWGIDPERVGVLGFSAGGHLASLLSTQPSLHLDPADDLAPRVRARPDFVVLAYPVVSFVEGYSPGAFVGSVDNFFGRRDVDESTRRRYSNELHVGADHPPVFLWTTADDELVPAAHSRLFAEACERANVPVSFTLFAHGPHGMGLALREADVATWTRRLLAWLAARGL
jgi:acetyl esterase/lipase